MKFEVEKTPTFSLSQTLNCGQVFRFREEGGVTLMHAGCHRAEARETADSYVFDCDDADFFKKYLDFDTNYDIIQLKTQDKGLVSAAIEFGKGIHILRQFPEETVFSFLVSQNNHIPRIKGIIERMCSALGRDMGGYRAFPEAVHRRASGKTHGAARRREKGGGLHSAFRFQPLRRLPRGHLDKESFRSLLRRYACGKALFSPCGKVRGVFGICSAMALLLQKRRKKCRQSLDKSMLLIYSIDGIT